MHKFNYALHLKIYNKYNNCISFIFLLVKYRDVDATKLEL